MKENRSLYNKLQELMVVQIYFQRFPKIPGVSVRFHMGNVTAVQ